MPNQKIKEMKALSVMQPWAHCIVFKGKNVENRPRKTHLRGTVAIHASMKKDQERFDILKDEYKIKLKMDEVAFGAVIGFADIVDVINRRQVTGKTRKWFVGDYGYVLSNFVALKKPVAAKGALGFWKLKGATLKKCLDQVPAAKRKKFKPLVRPNQ